MESIINSIQSEKRNFRLYQHPWLSLLAVMVTSIFSIGLTGNVIFGLLKLPDTSPFVQFSQAMSLHILTVFFLVPLVLRLPKRERTFTQYLDKLILSEGVSLSNVMLSRTLFYFEGLGAGEVIDVVFEVIVGEPVSLIVLDSSFGLPESSQPLLDALPLSAQLGHAETTVCTTASFENSK